MKAVGNILIFLAVVFTALYATACDVQIGTIATAAPPEVLILGQWNPDSPCSLTDWLPGLIIPIQFLDDGGLLALDGTIGYYNFDENYVGIIHLSWAERGGWETRYTLSTDTLTLYYFNDDGTKHLECIFHKVPLEPTPTPMITKMRSTPTVPSIYKWEGAVINTLCLEVVQVNTAPNTDSNEPVFENIQKTLVGMGMRVENNEPQVQCDATLNVNIAFTALGNYLGANCYEGAEVKGQMTLNSPGRMELFFPIEGFKQPPDFVQDDLCIRKIENAPYDMLWMKVVFNDLAEVWGPDVFVHALWVDGTNDPMYQVAQEALQELGPVAIPVCVAGLTDQDRLVRRNSAFILGDFGPEALDAVPALIQVLNDESISVRIAAASALRHITYENYGEDRTQWQNWWEQNK